jgi:RNA polymerase sigma factor (sigma-70 family)
MVNPSLGAAVRHIRKLTTSEAGRAATDGELIAAFSAHNDQAAFAGLVRRYGPLVLGVCRRVLRQEQDAEDAFQATFLVLARRAGTIRKRESLASWLHGVAYRVAMRARHQAARRRAREAQTKAAAPGDPSWKAAWQEVQAVLDEEIQALPEKCRAAFVLCCVEGYPQAEAARRLGVKEGTVWSRLAQARKLLQARLARRGVALSAVLAATALAAGRAPAVPAPLVGVTATAATLFAGDGAVPTGTVAENVLSLAKGVEKTMFPTTKTTALLLLTAGAVALGLGAALHVCYAAAHPVAPPQEAAAPAPQAPPAAPKTEAGTVEVSGRVLGPDGKPFAGAQLFVVNWAARREDQKILATTGDDGRFRIRVPAAEVEKTMLVAAAAGQGPDRAYLAEGTDDVTLRLVKDDLPVTGRVLDLEGRPVVGATVRVIWVDVVDLKPWLDDPKRVDLVKKKGLHVAMLDGPKLVKTGKDGRFRLTGFGRDRVAHLWIRGEGIENTDVEVIARDGNVAGLRLESRTVYSPGANFTVRPSKPIVGTVRDKKTGKPIAGIHVVCPGMQWDWPNATTDEKGHYRIDGVGKQKEYEVRAGGMPYFNAMKMQIPDTQGLDPLVVDFELAGGLVVRGRLTDKATGKPVHGRVNYSPTVDNPHAKDLPGMSVPIDHSIGETDENGSFTLVVVPGPGLLAAQADADHYQPASAGDVKTVNGLEGGGYQAFARIDADPKNEKSLRCDIAVEPGRSLDGKVVGPDDKPLTGARVAGLHQRYHFGEKPEKLAGDAFIVAGLGTAASRVLVFVHPEQKLARVQVIPAGRKDPLTVRLEPTGTLVGRVLDGAGKPLAGAAVEARYAFGQTVEGEGARGGLPTPLGFVDSGWMELLNGRAITDRDGRFRLAGLAPGLKYGLEAPGVERHDLSVQPGKDNDLGDLK